jgi:hypothetical protein
MENEAHHETRSVRQGEPAHRVIASYDNYSQAEAAVDYLAHRRFPVERWRSSDAISDSSNT